jgi:hypothetical protein
VKNSFFLSFFLVFVTGILFSQEYRIAGTIRNAENDPIPFANVLLFQANDSTLLKGASSDESGKFQILNVPNGSYLLAISYMGTQSPLQKLTLSADTDMGDLFYHEDTQVLDEVVVRYQKPRLEQQIDRLVFNIENTALSEGDIWDVLKKTPSIVVVQNQLTIKGNGNVGIMINERMVNLPQEDIINLLSGTSASNVEAIEVITNPPAKYSAEGGMLINIKMAQNLVSGYNGAIFNNYSLGVFPKNTIGTDHYFKSKYTDLSINYSFGSDKEIARYTDVTTFSENGTNTSVWNANQDLITKRKKHTLSAFFDFQLNTKNTLSVSSINGYNPKTNRYYDTKTLINDPNAVLLSSFNTTNDSDEDQINTSFYVDFVHKSQKKGEELSVNTHYTYYDTDRGQDIATDFFDVDGNPTGENDFTTRSQQKINLYSLQLDYVSPLNESSEMEAGLRYAGIDSESSITQAGYDRNQPGIDPTEAGLFKYDEAIYAAYLSYNAKWDALNFKTGLRAEYTQTMGDLDRVAEPTHHNYLELFPSLSMDYKLAEKHNLTFYYYRRINRPRYSSINPFQYFQSNNSVIEGNPDLLPATRHYVAAGYTYDRSYTFEIFYKNEKNLNQVQVFQDNQTNLLRFIHQNLQSDISYGFDVIVNTDITKFWDTYLIFSGYNRKDTFSDLETAQTLNNSLWSWLVQTSSNFNLLKDNSFYAYVDFVYYSRTVYGNSKQDASGQLGLTLRKTLWNKKASISLGISDIFKQSDIFTTRKFLDQNNSSYYRGENRLLTLGFRYKFGNVKIRDNQKSKSVEERNRI